MFGFSDTAITMGGLLGALYGVIAVLIIAVLYHLLFIVVDLRKIMRRFEDTTAQVEAMILKPIAIIDEAFQWVMDHLQSKKAKKPKRKEDEEGFEVEDV